MKNIVKACIILHNMIIADHADELDDVGQIEGRVVDLSRNYSLNYRPESPNDSVAVLCARAQFVRDADRHFELRDALVEHHLGTTGLVA
jgi:hypothetical protein